MYKKQPLERNLLYLASLHRQGIVAAPQAYFAKQSMERVRRGTAESSVYTLTAFGRQRINAPKVANGGWENGEKVLEKAFHDKETCDAVHFYYNDNQDYYCNPNVGEDMWFTSINKLEELYNK